MVGFDAAESLTPFREADAYGAVLFDQRQFRKVDPAWFDPAHWGENARPVPSGGRGGAWFVDAPFGRALLRHYLRGGWATIISRDRYLWRSAARVRSFAEFRLTGALHARGLPVPRPLAAWYLRHGWGYRAAILLERLVDVRSLGERMGAGTAPWREAGQLVARFHRAGLDHADLNAHNLLFDAAGRGWMIDFDRGRLRIPATGWRERNLARLQRSLRKLAGDADIDVGFGFGQLRLAYDDAWKRGY